MISLEAAGMLGGKILGRGRNGGTLEHSHYTGGAWRTEALTGLQDPRDSKDSKGSSSRVEGARLFFLMGIVRLGLLGFLK